MDAPRHWGPAKHMFQVGQVVHFAGGNEAMIESFDGWDDLNREVYTVVTTNVTVTIDGRPMNRRKAIVIPTLTLQGYVV